MGQVLLVSGILASSIFAFGFHVLIGPMIQQWVGQQMQGVPLNRTGAAVGTLAFATAIVDIAAIALLQILLHRRLPGGSPLLKGLVFGVLLLAVRGRFPRMFIMNLAIGNPLPVVLVQESEGWIIMLSSPVILAYTIAAAAKRGAVLRAHASAGESV